MKTRNHLLLKYTAGNLTCTIIFIKLYLLVPSLLPQLSTSLWPLVTAHLLTANPPMSLISALSFPLLITGRNWEGGNCPSPRTQPSLHFSDGKYSYISVRQWGSICTTAIWKPFFLQLLVNITKLLLRPAPFSFQGILSLSLLFSFTNLSLIVQILIPAPYSSPLQVLPLFLGTTTWTALLRSQHLLPWTHLQWSVDEQVKFMNFTSWPHLGHVHDP